MLYWFHPGSNFVPILVLHVACLSLCSFIVEIMLQGNTLYLMTVVTMIPVA
jgi:hypothetical protein